VPGCWDGFELTTRAILGQQVSVAAATTMAGRLAKSFGRAVLFGNKLNRLFPTPQDLADADFSGIGLPKSRVASIHALARSVCMGDISFERSSDPELLLKKLLDIPGVGNWTTQYVAMRALRDPDAFPSEDLGLIRALGLGKAGDLERRSKAWSPWRSYAAMHLWNFAGERAERMKSGARPARRRWDEGPRDESYVAILT
jgi:AraC family transcriptional regulator, regulatory protein of adaptative response / DNA-3-methyladenine glycosylase II